VFGVLAAAAVIAPREYVELIFPPTPVRLRTMAVILLGVAAYTVFFHSHTPGLNAGGEAAHLGGALMGLYLIKRPDALDWADRRDAAPPA
jgi:membrane associated rhomboid family serine protease